MTEFRIGDIVRLTKGEPDRPGYKRWVREVSYDRVSPEMIELAFLHIYREKGWTVELLERPPAPLPTKPNTLGWVTVGGGRGIVRRNAGGTWILYDEGGFDYVVLDEDLSDFTEAVLIPKELADRVTEWAERDAMDGYRLLGDLADHLEGQDND